MDKTVDVFLISRSIGQFRYFSRRRIDEPDAIGGSNGDASVRQLEHILDVMDGIVAGAACRLLGEVAIKTTHPQVALVVVEHTVDVVVLQVAIGYRVQNTRLSVLGKFEHSLSVGGCEHSTPWGVAQV